jgi:SSS family transporter
MTAVIWTDVIQMFLYVAGALVSFAVILQHIPGGWDQVWNVAGAAGKFQIFDFRLGPATEFFSRTYSFWAGLIGGCFLTTASHGTEQLMVQRLLAARSQKDSRLALFGSWIVIFIQFSLFLLIGVILYVFYTTTGLTAPSPGDRIYPDFVWRYLPTGVAGLVVAAILAAAMSNLSAALNSLASTSIMDFYKPLAARRGVQHSEAHYLRLARLATVVWGVVLMGIGYVARRPGSVLEAGLSIASIISGSLLGVFLLGVLTRRVGEKAAIAGMMVGLFIMLGVKQYTNIAFTWYVLIGTSVTFSAGYLTSWLHRENMNA